MAGILYADKNYSGASYNLTTSNPDLKSTPVGYGTSSMKVNKGYRVTLYSRTNYTGNSAILLGPISVDFVPTNRVPLASNIYFHDELKSIKVEPLAQITESGQRVIGAIKQTAPTTNLNYSTISGDCSYANHSTTTYPAGYMDWQYGESSGLLGKQAKCSVIDTTVCPIIGSSAPVDIQWANPGKNKQATGVDRNFSGALVNCVYDLNNFKTGEDVNIWLNTSWDNRSVAIQQYDQQIMPNFCAQQVTTCPIDPITSQRSSQCSRFVSTEIDGSVCRTWVANGLLGNQGFGPGNANTAMQKYCAANNTPDCSCLNRTQNDSYRQLTGLAAGSQIQPQSFGPASCWWNPCRFPDQIVLTSDLAKPTCNIQVCQELQNFYNNQYSVINTGEIKSNIACNFQAPGGVPPITPAGTPPSQPTAPTTPTTPTTPITPITPSQPRRGIPVWVWIILAIIIILLIAGIVGAILFSRRKAV